VGELAFCLLGAGGSIPEALLVLSGLSRVGTSHQSRDQSYSQCTSLDIEAGAG